MKSHNLTIEVNASELLDWKHTIQFFENPKTMLKEITEGHMVIVKHYTPVNTGHLKSRWKMDKIRPSPQNKGFGYETYLLNDTPYCDYVNYGHKAGSSYVHGKYFIQKAINQYKIKDVKKKWFR